jgi:hypothetical protein
MPAPLAQDSPAQPQPVASARDAQELIGHYNEVMDTLLQVIEQETELVRAGRLRDAAQLESHKSELARLYVADTTRLQASKPYLAATQPDLLASLRQRYDAFRALLQVNLTVLATAHAVSEGIMRGVANEITRKSVPQTYGASGRQVLPGARHAQPLSVSRSL